MEQNILTQLLKMYPSQESMKLPPNVFLDMDGEFIEYVEGKSLTARFPNKTRYMNPFGFMQGGIIVAAIDNTVSPLSYVVAPPSLTKEMTTTYHRPITSRDKFIVVHASIIEKTIKSISLQAEVRNEQGKLAAKGIAHCIFIKEKNRNNGSILSFCNRATDQISISCSQRHFTPDNQPTE